MAPPGAWTDPHHPTGRPPLDQHTQQLIVRLARENPRWGYQRSKGELQRLSVHVSATAIRTTLRRRGLDPAPRPTAATWRAFRASAKSKIGPVRTVGSVDPILGDEQLACSPFVGT
jgi:hypothetical protein